MAIVLGINACSRPPAALVIDGRVVAAPRRSLQTAGSTQYPGAVLHVGDAVEAAKWCWARGVDPADVDAIGYSYDPALAPPVTDDLTTDQWEGLRTLFARRAPLFLQAALPGIDGDKLSFIPHHVAHAASTHLAAPFASSAVLVVDGRGERGSSGRHARDGDLQTLADQSLPTARPLYEELTAHLGFRRSSTSTR